MVKKLAVLLVTLAFLAAPAVVKAEDQVIICPQAYGAGVVCGVHTTVNTGIGDNLLVVATGFLGASAIFAYFSKKLKKSQ